MILSRSNFRNVSFSLRLSLIFVVATIFQSITLEGQALKRFEFAQPKMGTEFRIVFYCQDDSLANIIQDTVFKHIDHLNQIFSDYELDSELNRIVRFEGNDTIRRVSHILYDILSVSTTISELTDGAFDITIGPLSKLWRRAIRRNEFIDETELVEANRLVNYKNLKLLGNNKIQLLTPDMRLDLGGIAKGKTVDEVFYLIQSYGVSQVLVDGGGDIRVGEAPPNSEGWKIKLSHSTMEVSNTAIATSGDTYKFIEHNGERYAHIIDPRTGYGVKNANNLMVIANSCQIADAIASAASILNNDELSLVKSKYELQVFYDP